MLILAKPCVAEEATIAVASNFTSAMQELATDFERQSGHRIHLAFGSSGKFFAQISNGAPFDAFFSADQAKPAALEQAGQTVSGSRLTYAVGALALWSINQQMDQNGDVLRRNQFNKLALANPRLAPYGAAAVQVLTNLGLDKTSRAKWVQGENISQTYQFVGSGNADLGFVALSQIYANGQLAQGSAWIVPKELYAPIRQDAVVLKKGEKNQAVIDLFAYLKTKRARSVIESFGYQNEGPAIE
ncbi:molybdate ABC transporter substrate-binding protein [Hahella sp. CCB-MM4]|nr:molybdate ABC transporter substrate-binding protein [Hahella sp. CCB-MM4]